MILENVNNVQCKVEIVTIGATYEVLDLPDYEPIDDNGTIKSGSNLALKIIPLEEMDDTLVLTVTVVRNGIEEEINIDSDICYIHNIVTDITIKIELKYAFNVIMYHIDGDVFTGEYSSESDTELIIPSKPHFIFHGWYDNEKYYGEEILILKAGSKWSKVFYGYYEAIVYILSLDVNGGEQLLKTTFEMTFSESGYLLPVPTKIGYEFLGWFSSREGEKAYTDNNGKSYQVWREDGDRTFYAHWQAKKYNIMLDANGGEVSQSSIEVIYDQNYILPVPVKVGSHFVGWFTGNTNGIAYTDELGNSINVWNNNEDVKLYAHWNDVNQLTLESNGGDPLKNKNRYVKYNQIYILPIPNRRGYKFLGWFSVNGEAYTDLEGNSLGIWKELGNKILYAHWEVKEYEVKLNINHGTYDTNIVRLTYDQDYKLPMPIQSAGYIFKGWFSSGIGGIAYTDTNGNSLTAWKEATNSKILYAHWEPQKYTVTLDLNYGTNSVYDEKDLTYGVVYYLTKVPNRPGYRFLGWYNSEGLAYTDSTGYCFEVWNETKNITLYAHWEVRKYKITFEKEWGFGGDPNILEYTYASIIENIIPPTRIGFTFLGYFLAPNDKNSKQIFNAAGAPVSKTFNFIDDLTVYAIWEEKHYTISLDRIHFDENSPHQIEIYENIPVTQIISCNCEIWNHWTYKNVTRVFTRWAVIIGDASNYDSVTNPWHTLFSYMDISFTPLDIINKFYPDLADGKKLTVRAVFAS